MATVDQKDSYLIVISDRCPLHLCTGMAEQQKKRVEERHGQHARSFFVLSASTDGSSAQKSTNRSIHQAALMILQRFIYLGLSKILFFK